MHVGSPVVPCGTPASLSPGGTASLVIVHCREIKEFQSEALECLAASQVSYEELNPIVASTPPLSVHWVGVGGAESLTVPAPLSL